MASEKLVRCYVSKRENGNSPQSPRFIPLDVFQLWEFLMQERHHFDVAAPTASLWFERGDATESTYSGLDVEQVTRVELFFYSEEDGMLHQKVRYFPSADVDSYEEIRETFLSHYRERGVTGGRRLNYSENPGVWIKR